MLGGGVGAGGQPLLGVGSPSIFALFIEFHLILFVKEQIKSVCAFEAQGSILRHRVVGV